MITFLQETPGDGAKRMMYNVQDYRVFFSFYFFMITLFACYMGGLAF